MQQLSSYFERISLQDGVRSIVVVAAGWTLVFGGFQFLRVIKTSRISRDRAKGLLVPPGPKPLPIIGNLLDMPQSKPWETLTAWGREYGTLHSTFLKERVNGMDHRTCRTCCSTREEHCLSQYSQICQ